MYPNSQYGIKRRKHSKEKEEPKKTTCRARRATRRSSPTRRHSAVSELYIIQKEKNAITPACSRPQSGLQKRKFFKADA